MVIDIYYWMKQLDPESLEQKIQLVKWQNKKHPRIFDLMTIHSLLIDDNPKFQYLKSIIKQYNNQNQSTNLSRPNLKYGYIQQLYKMLSYLVNISNMQNQLQFLNKIYQWAHTQLSIQQQPNPHNYKNVRPTTASTLTKTRPFSANSRPISANFKEIIKLNESESVEINKDNKLVNYEKLQLGQKQFYEGSRTLHPQIQHPRKRLKEFHRKLFYEQNDGDSEYQLIEFQEPFKQIPKVQEIKHRQSNIKQNPQLVNQSHQISDSKPQDQILQSNQLQGLGQSLANIDDIPLEIEQQQHNEEEQEEVIDRLRPKTKPYINKQQYNIYSKQYYQGLYKYRAERHQMRNTIAQEREMIQIMSKYNHYRAAAKSQTKRRIQTNSIVRQKLGIPTQNEQSKEINLGKVDDLTMLPIPCTRTGKVRPRTAFTSFTHKNLKQKINEAMQTAKINTHISQQISAQGAQHARYKSLTTYAPKNNKKTFQEILYEAQEKANRQALEQTQKIKQILAKNKVPITISTLVNSIGYQDIQLPGQDIPFGQIGGIGMLKNPYFKVSKKKKKKKKKK